MEKSTFLEIRNRLDFSRPHSVLLTQLALDTALIVASGWLLASGSPLANGVAQLLLACVFFRAFSLMHEAVHGTLSRSQQINDWAGLFYGALCFLPYSTWKEIHLDHHVWAGNSDKDPTMKMVRKYPHHTPRIQRLHSLIWRSWVPYIAFLQEVVFWTVSARFVFEGRVKRKQSLQLALSLVGPVVAFAAVLAAGAAFGHPLLLMPAFVIYLCLVEVINFPHHLRLPRMSGERSLKLWEQYKVSRTCVYSPWFSSFVLLNFNYHAEHHMFPNLPWHRLPEAHRLVRAALRAGEYNMCVGHSWIMENRRLPLEQVFAPTRSLNEEVPAREKAA